MKIQYVYEFMDSTLASCWTADRGGHSSVASCSNKQTTMFWLIIHVRWKFFFSKRIIDGSFGRWRSLACLRSISSHLDGRLAFRKSKSDLVSISEPKFCIPIHHLIKNPITKTHINHNYFAEIVILHKQNRTTLSFILIWFELKRRKTTDKRHTHTLDIMHHFALNNLFSSEIEFIFLQQRRLRAQHKWQQRCEGTMQTRKEESRKKNWEKINFMCDVAERGQSMAKVRPTWLPHPNSFIQIQFRIKNIERVCLQCTL